MSAEAFCTEPGAIRTVSDGCDRVSSDLEDSVSPAISYCSLTEGSTLGRTVLSTGEIKPLTCR